MKIKPLVFFSLFQLEVPLCFIAVDQNVCLYQAFKNCVLQSMKWPQAKCRSVVVQYTKMAFYKVLKATFCTPKFLEAKYFGV